MLELHGKTILVTGAAGTGVGAGVCQAVTQAGGRLVLNDLDEMALSQAASTYPDALPVAANIAEPGQVDALFARVEAAGIQLNGLVNNAGVGLSCYAEAATEADYDRLQSIDVRGLWLVTKRFVRHLKLTGRTGSIVNISSVHAHATMQRYALYAGMKANVEGLTRGLAVELGPAGIRCNAVAPGYVHSEQNLELIGAWTDDPAGWVAAHTHNQQALEYEIAPIDCGWAVAFLLSDLSRCITGQALRVDAGMTAMLYNKDFL